MNQIIWTHNTRKGYSTGSTLDGALSLVISRGRVEKEETWFSHFLVFGSIHQSFRNNNVAIEYKPILQSIKYFHSLCLVSFMSFVPQIIFKRALVVRAVTNIWIHGHYHSVPRGSGFSLSFALEKLEEDKISVQGFATNGGFCLCTAIMKYSKQSFY